MARTYGEGLKPRYKKKKWSAEFRIGRDSTVEDPHPGRPATPTNKKPCPSPSL